LTGGVLPDPTTREGRAGLEAILGDPEGALAAFDYDGTLSPIVADPATAIPEQGVVDRLARLASRIGAVAIVTGRPAQQAVDLGRFGETPGLDRLTVLGQYGVERWTPQSGLQTVDPAPGVDEVRRRLPGLLRSLGLEGAEVEDKRLALVVHVRRLEDPAGAFATMVEPLTELATSAGLVAERGRHVVELRPPGIDKGQALRSLVSEVSARSVMFTGDDRGDLPAFAEVARLRDDGVPGLLVCSGSDEVGEVAEQADLVVDGPPGVARFLDDLLAALSGRSG
jgi:trehalose 6-phosphate phosphatase